MGDPVRASALFAWLYDHCDGLLELRAFGRGGTPPAHTFAPLDAIATLAPFVQAHHATNVFFGLATRRDATSGALSNCLHLPCGFVDLDCRTNKPAALAALDRFPVPPSLVLDSSVGGLYALWKWREPLVVAETDPKPVLRRLAATFAHVGADRSAAEAARVLRVPGTLNPKYVPARAVTVRSWGAGEINPSDLEEWLTPLDPDGGPSATGRPRPGPETTFNAGDRYTALFEEARRLKRQGHLFDEVLALLEKFNELRCRPAHGPADVRRACTDAYRAADRPGHEPRQIRLEDAAPPGTWAPPPDEPPPAADTADARAEPAPDDDEWAVPLPTFLAQQTVPPPPMLVPGLVPGAGLVLPHGDPRTMKTMLSLDLALGLSTGEKVCGLLEVREPVGVLYVSNEDRAAETAERLTKLLAGRGRTRLPECFYLAVHRGVWLDTPAWQDKIIALVTRHRIRFVAFDPARSVTYAVDQGPAEIRPLVRFLKELQLRTGAVVWLAHHDVKPLAGGRDDRRRAHRASGGGLFSAADAPIHLESIGEGRTLVLPGDWKFCASPPTFEIRLEATDTTLRLVAVSAATDDARVLQLDARVLAWVTKHPGKSTRVVVAGVKARTADVMAALKRLEDAGRVVKTDEAKGYAWTAATRKEA